MRDYTNIPKELSSPTTDIQWIRRDQENEAAFLSAKLPPDPFFQNISYVSQAAIVSIQSESMRVII